MANANVLPPPTPAQPLAEFLPGPENNAPSLTEIHVAPGHGDPSDQLLHYGQAHNAEDLRGLRWTGTDVRDGKQTFVVEEASAETINRVEYDVNYGRWNKIAMGFQKRVLDKVLPEVTPKMFGGSAEPTFLGPRNPGWDLAGGLQWDGHAQVKEVKEIKGHARLVNVYNDVGILVRSIQFANTDEFKTYINKNTTVEAHGGGGHGGGGHGGGGHGGGHDENPYSMKFSHFEMPTNIEARPTIEDHIPYSGDQAKPIQVETLLEQAQRLGNYDGMQGFTFVQGNRRHTVKFDRIFQNAVNLKGYEKSGYLEPKVSIETTYLTVRHDEGDADNRSAGGTEMKRHRLIGYEDFQLMLNEAGNSSDAQGEWRLSAAESESVKFQRQQEVLRLEAEQHHVRAATLARYAAGVIIGPPEAQPADQMVNVHQAVTLLSQPDKPGWETRAQASLTRVTRVQSSRERLVAVKDGRGNDILDRHGDEITEIRRDNDGHILMDTSGNPILVAEHENKSMDIDAFDDRIAFGLAQTINELGIEYVSNVAKEMLSNYKKTMEHAGMFRLADEASVSDLLGSMVGLRMEAQDTNSRHNSADDPFANTAEGLHTRQAILQHSIGENFMMNALTPERTVINAAGEQGVIWRARADVFYSLPPAVLGTVQYLLDIKNSTMMADPNEVSANTLRRIGGILGLMHEDPRAEAKRAEARRERQRRASPRYRQALAA
jgi:hypothetical protein